MPTHIQLGSRVIHADSPCFVIAEAGVNHNGDPERALELVRIAARAGADAVKFQTFRSDEIVSPQAPKAKYQQSATAKNESQLDMLRRLELSPSVHEKLMTLCRELGLLFLSTPFDSQSADYLDAAGMPAFKIASGEITNLALLKHIAGMQKPMLLSTGMSYLEEVDLAVRTIFAAGNRQLALLHCVSCYPAAPEEVNLKAMDTLAQKFGLPVGYSDHTLGIDIALAAVARGACVIEKHFTLSRDLPGPDHAASLEPEELTRMVTQIRRVQSALGSAEKCPAPREEEMRAIARRSLMAAVPLHEGTLLTAQMLTAKRPGTGISPARIAEVVGKVIRQDVPPGTPITWDML